MKEALCQLSLGSIGIHVPTFDCDIDHGNYSPNPADQIVPPGLASYLYFDRKGDQYKLMPLISNRLMPSHVSSIPFGCTLAHPKKQDKMQYKIQVNNEKPKD